MEMKPCYECDFIIVWKHYCIDSNMIVSHIQNNYSDLSTHSPDSSLVFYSRIKN